MTTHDSEITFARTARARDSKRETVGGRASRRYGFSTSAANTTTLRRLPPRVSLFVLIIEDLRATDALATAGVISLALTCANDR